MSTSSSNWNQSSSSSEPTVIRTPENDLINAISGVASGLANQMNGWADRVFAQTSQVTDQAVGNFMQVSRQMQGLSTSLTNQYNNVFAPQNRSLAHEANVYNSDARQRNDMGAAGAVASQAGDNALEAAEERLRSFGINPSDGRYAALQKAAAVENAAKVAGAMNQQRERTAQVGRDLRTQAVQVGAQMPSQIAQVNNVANQANAGASQATNANANTGANLKRIPNDYLRTAMDIKLPPTGQKQSSSGSGGGQSSGDSGGGGPRGGGGAGPGGGGSGGGRGGGDGGGPGWQRVTGAPGQGGPQLQTHKFNDYNVNKITDHLNNSNFDYLNNNDIYQSEGDYSIGLDRDFQSSDAFENYGGAGSGGFSDYDFGQNGWDETYGQGGDYDTYGNMGGGSDTPWGNISYDTEANSVDTGWGQTYDEPVATDWGTGAQAYQDYGGGGDSWGSSGGSGSDSYNAYSDENYYADGGPVPPSRSPSGGAMVDDVQVPSPQGPANLNVGEFVIPQDVALWKGQEFFQKLIEQSRQKRVTAPAGGPSKQPPQQPMR